MAKSAVGKTDPLLRRETLELVRAFYSIRDPALREKLDLLIRQIAEAFNGANASSDT